MSIHTRGLLVSLVIGMPPQSKKIMAASEKVELDNGTAPNQAAVVSRLFAKEDVRELQKAATAARAFFKKTTLPYSRGVGLMNAANYFEFLSSMTMYKEAFEREKNRIVDNMEQVLENASRVNGDLFDMKHYPSMLELQENIMFHIEVTPVPMANDFDKLADLSPDEIEKLQQEAVLSQQSKTQAAMRDLFERLLTTLKHAAERLSDDETGGCKIFRDTLVSNIEEAIIAAETLNITDDEELKKLSDEVKEIIDGVTAAELRKDVTLRKETARKSQELASRIESLF